MSLTAAQGTALAGLGQTAAGLGTQAFGAAQGFGLASDLTNAAEQDALNTVLTGEEAAAVATENAYAALDDAALTRGLTRLRIGDIRKALGRLSGQIQSATAVSGLMLSGSPLLALGEAVYEAERSAGIEAITGRRRAARFDQEVRDNLRTADQARRRSRQAAGVDLSIARSRARFLTSQSVIGLGQTAQGALSLVQPTMSLFRTRPTTTTQPTNQEVLLR